MVFQTKYGHFKYQVILFRLSNAPVSFQSYINKVLAKKLDIFIIVYLDGILIYTKNSSQVHINTFQWIFKKLPKYKLSANLKKCQFCKNEVKFLGYVILVQKIKIEEKQIEAMKN